MLVNALYIQRHCSKYFLSLQRVVILDAIQVESQSIGIQLHIHRKGILPVEKILDPFDFFLVVIYA